MTYYLTFFKTEDIDRPPAIDAVPSLQVTLPIQGAVEVPGCFSPNVKFNACLRAMGLSAFVIDGEDLPGLTDEHLDGGQEIMAATKRLRAGQPD